MPTPCGLSRKKRRGNEVARAAPGDREQVLAGLKELSDRLDEAEARLRAAEADLAELQARIPNLPEEATPAGGEEDAVELRRVGTPPSFDFEVRDHLELGELLGAIDTVRAAKVSGARFGYLVGPGALLELLRQGHPRHLPGPPVRQGRDGVVRAP